MGRRNRQRDDDDDEGLAHRVITMLLRLAQLACACIVMGILARFCYLITVAQVTANSRIVYTLVIAGITIVFSVLFCAPFNILAIAFPFDFVLFVTWLVAFSLLASVSPSTREMSRGTRLTRRCSNPITATLTGSTTTGATTGVGGGTMVLSAWFPGTMAAAIGRRRWHSASLRR
jgi:occludin/MAL family lipid-associated protein